MTPQTTSEPETLSFTLKLPLKRSPGGQAHLLIFFGSMCQRRSLPSAGTLIVGRSPDAHICINAAAISRRHAKLMIAGGEVRIADLQSHNGTLVNGECIKGARALCSGDVVTLGGATLVFQRDHGVPGRVALDARKLRLRLAEELDRALSYSRPLAVAVISLGDSVSDRAAAVARAEPTLRPMDVLGWDGATHLVAVLPELGGEAAREVASRLVKALAPVSAEVRGGLAVCPVDGCDAGTLLSGARAATSVAAPSALALAAETTVRYTAGDRSIFAADPAMIRLFDLIRRLSASDLPVLVLGETGTGKENAASALHHWSPRSEKPLVALNCAALPEALIESELFGYEKGAFSDARAPKPGLLERANGGTVFLDEVGELSLAAQAKLLRALEVKRITRLGDTRERAIDVRVVAATNRDLEAESLAGTFRRDLLFRLSAAVLELPPLRQRPREVPILARLFLGEACARAGRSLLEVSEAALYKLASYSWPGNVRELKNAMEFAVATAEGAVIEPWNLPERVAGRAQPAAPREAAASAATPPESATSGPSEPAPRRFQPIAEELRAMERARMVEALEATGGVQTRAAELIRMPIRTFALKVKQYGISPREARRP